MHGRHFGGSLNCSLPEQRDASAMPAARSSQRLDDEAPVVDSSSSFPETLCTLVRTITNAHSQPEEISMQKFFQSGYAFALLALLFSAVGVVSDRPAVYITLGAAFLILALATRKRNAQKAQPTTDPSK